MKIPTRSILRILRTYHIANDNTPVRAIRMRETVDYESYIQTSFVFEKRKFALLFGSNVDEENVDELWAQKPPTATLLKNPLDETNYTMPFQGKYVVLLEIPTTKQRLDVYLATTFDSSISRSLWQKYIAAGYIQVNGTIVTSTKADISDTDDIVVTIPETSQEHTDLPIIYEDEDVVVIDKPIGMLTHAKGGIAQEETIADALRHKMTFGSEGDRPGIVHRLDRDTSGVLIAARNQEAAVFLQKQFANRHAKKTYIAVIEGVPKITEAKIDLPIGRNPAKPSTFRVDPKGKSAQTIYKVLATNGAHSLVELRPHTGRTHQLRVHMAHIGTPIVGDRVYGAPEQRLMLHAYKLTIPLPSGEEKTFIAKLPGSFLEEFDGITL